MIRALSKAGFMRARLTFVISAALAISFHAAAQIPPLTSEFQVNSFTSNDQIAYGAAMDRKGNFVIAWDSDGEDGNSFAAVARLFDETQTPKTGDLQVNTFTTGDQIYARVGMDGAGRFVVVWTSPQGGSSGIAAGCQTSPPLFCPTDPTKRKQMAPFPVKTFGLQLYGAD